MVYLVINGLGFNCGYNREDCPKKTLTCKECLLNQLKEFGFDINSNTTIYLIESKEKSAQIEHERIWKKFLDILNIKHVIIMDKHSGLALLNYPVSTVNINSELLSGFIQANITFSESEKELNFGNNSHLEYPFYELQYERFNILLKNGNYVRFCFVLDQKASNNMKSSVSRFLKEFEIQFKEPLENLQKTGAFKSENMVDFIINSFNINLMFPMTLAHAIPPEVLEKINMNQVQKAIINLIQELLASKSFFYVNTLLDRLKKIVNLDAKIILYEIYQLFEKRVIEPISLEVIANHIESSEELINDKTKKIRPISSIIVGDININELKEQVREMDDSSAKKAIKNFIKKARSSEKTSTYEVARNDYNKALFIAREFKFKNEEQKISKSLFELEKQAKEVELDFILESGEKAEKNNDYINAINYFQKGIKILEGFLIYNITDPRIKKLKKKILKLREEI
ncbi:MAG: hypothetical protein EU539_11800 [Promethearchaeota archaeon]|nr:MAG: hypothetical protein EU539_11800 [Candidatus Lokiarchaeota archaeon]